MDKQDYDELVIDISNDLFNLDRPNYSNNNCDKWSHAQYLDIILPRNPSEICDLRKRICDFLIKNTVVLDKKTVAKINHMLKIELKSKHLVACCEIPFKNIYESKIRLWKGDITMLCTDYIVNAANSQGLGCFTVGHKCIDNVIHQNAGPQLREECIKIMKDKKTINTSDLIVTQGYNLPSKYILHVVGPIYNPEDKLKNSTDLAKSYINCLNTVAARYNNMPVSIAFCCISTGIFGYPKEEASDIAISTVIRWIAMHQKYKLDVVFCVYDDENYTLYKNRIK